MRVSRRGLLGGALGAAALPRLGQARDIAPNWSALATAWDVPEWFRDAKFGIWAHWSAQCVPEAGDWYGRLMYLQAHPHYAHHLKHYGHPADRGFLEIENLWKAENWDPDYLVRLYKAAGAKYFMALANHHDNLDAYDSAHHAWNTLRVGPKRDIVGGWEQVVRREGLKFGVSNHSAHAWHWYQTAYGYDTIGPRAGERYDAFKLTRADGKGKWWDGLDPQELYCGPSFVAPDGIQSIASMDAWHETHDARWMEFIPPSNPQFARKWLLRQNDLVDKYKPDLVYFDNFGMPMEHLGLEAVAHYYGRAIDWHGTPDVLATAKVLPAYDQKVLVDDVERGFSDRLRERPWQTCTCIGDWHYNRARFDQKSYVPAEQVIQRLCDIVSKNGNLLLSIPVRGDGTIDGEEEKIVAGITGWMRVHGEPVIHGSRPWRTFGEGPTDLSGGMFNEEKGGSFTARDVRFTVKDGGLNVIFLKWPTEPVAVAALGGRALGSARIAKAALAGGGEVAVDQQGDAAVFTLPPPRAGAVAPVVRIEGRGIV